ncbi:MAG TPA: single-stranded DNA-binding protein [Solirubrobacteraceae bacterium]|nr:single-stranded DNA-binding protein [Solirubrobacteraceae bacterium]
MAYSSVNRVVLVGRLTHDPELRALPSGLSVCGLRVACNSSRRDAEGEYHDKPNYFDVSVFGSAGENVHRHMRRGALVAIDGRLEWREWETAEQQKRQAVSVVADSVQFLDKPDSVQGEVDDDDDDTLGGSDVGERERELVGVGAGVDLDEDDLVF